MVHLYIIRHGETEENAAGILQGHMPGHLTEKGRAQAAETRDLLTTRGAKPDTLLCSDLLRAVETAQTVNEAYGLPLCPTPLLRERDWGAMTGTKIADAAVLERFPDDVESVEDMTLRARRLLGLLLERYDGHCVLCVGHGLFNRCLIAAAEGRTLHDVPRMANGEIRELLLTNLPALPQPSDRKPATAASAGKSADEASAN